MTEYGVTYPQLKILRADMVHTHGVSPSMCYCLATPETPTDKTAISDGTLTFTRDGAPFFSFKHCAIRNFYLQAPGPRNELRAEVEIVDRRHLWQYQTVGGRYNVPDSTGEIGPDYVKSWHELFALLLEALGEEEGSYDITLPEDDVPAPAVRWDCTRADLALADLAEQAGCIICLTNDDRIIIEPRGSGPLYELTDDARMPIAPFPVDVVCPAVAIQFAPTRYQMWITCEAMAINCDTTLGPLHEADWLDDYAVFRQHNAPGVYNDTDDPDEPYWGVKDDELSKTVFCKQKDMLYRMYRVKELYHFEDNTLPYGGHFNDIDDILPLHETNLFRIRPSVESPTTPLLADIQETWNDTFDNTPPFVLVHGIGDFSWPADGADGAEVGGFFAEPGAPTTIDLPRGIVYFDRFMFAIGTDGYTDPAEVYINATFNVRDPDTGSYRRYLCTPSECAPSECDCVSTVKYEDIFLYVDVPANSEDPIHTNRTELKEEVCPGLVARYSHTDLVSSFVQWNGLKNYSTRGNVPQMRWHVSQHWVYTEGGRNFEHPLLAPTEAARRRKERD